MDIQTNTNSQPESKNEYFAKKEIREKTAMAAQNKKKVKKLITALIYLVILVVVVFGVFKLATKKGPPVPGEFFPAQSRQHINPGESHPPYNSNPPTGGWHYGQPVQTGIYDKPLPDEELIHNLEHGHIWIAYKPDLPKDQIEQLVKIAKSYGSRIVMTPRAANDSPIAIVAWQHLFKLQNVDEPQIRVFINAYRNVAGPEKNIPDFGFGDFRGKTNVPSVSPMHNP